MVYRLGQVFQGGFVITGIVPHGKGKYRLVCVPLGEDNRPSEPHDPLQDEQWVIVDASEVDLQLPPTAWERLLRDDED